MSKRWKLWSYPIFLNKGTAHRYSFWGHIFCTGNTEIFFAGEQQENFSQPLSTVSQWYGFTGRILTKILAVSQEICARNCASKTLFPHHRLDSCSFRDMVQDGIYEEGDRSANLAHIPFRSPSSWNRVRRTSGSIYKSCSSSKASADPAEREEGGKTPVTPHRLVHTLTCPLEQPLSLTNLEQELGTISPVVWTNPRAQNEETRESDWISKFQSCS